jgi:hypothetical protein
MLPFAQASAAASAALFGTKTAANAGSGLKQYQVSLRITSATAAANGFWYTSVILCY